MKASSIQYFQFWLLAFLAGSARSFSPKLQRSAHNTKLPIRLIPFQAKESGNDEEDEATISEASLKDTEKERRKTQVAKAAAQIIKRKDSDETNESNGLFDKLNPFQAGKNLRQTFDSAISSLARASSGSTVSSVADPQSIYYLDDRFQESGGALFTQETNPYLSRLEKEDYVPEVLVVGATGEVGRLVVRRLLLEGRSRVRVLVPDLYSKTLNMLGTGVVYCQGDLSNVESLEYALTDVDKIIAVENPPSPDEEGFQGKFMGFAKDFLRGDDDSVLGKIEHSPYDQGATEADMTAADMEWERMEEVLEVRARLAEQIDFLGIQNLVKAYQNVRYADYGTSQAAKRSLFKFQSRVEDFNVFAIDDSDTEDEMDGTVTTEGVVENGFTGDKLRKAPKESFAYTSADDASVFDEYADDFEKYADAYGDYADGFQNSEDQYADYTGMLDSTNGAGEKRQDTAVKTQLQWIRNEFGHGVFVGKVPKRTAGGIGGEASLISSRLRSRDGGPEDGIDLSKGFGGFVCRICADGGVYEAFIRDAAYERNGIEYVCEFSTASKLPKRGNASRNKFTTVRLPFESFKPVQRRSVVQDQGQDPISQFKGGDVRHLGFRYRSSRNSNIGRAKQKDASMSSFYIAFSYIKLYRIQPEPEFVYLSDARIPPVVSDSQVRHDLRQLVASESLSSTGSSEADSFQIFDDNALQQMTSDKTARSPEETYFKYRGEQVLKGSGLSYAIARVLGYNESPSSEASTIDLKSNNDDVKSVSRAEVAQVCVSALLDPNALNKSFYVTKKEKGSTIDEAMTAKFAALSEDPVKQS